MEESPHEKVYLPTQFSDLGTGEQYESFSDLQAFEDENNYDIEKYLRNLLKNNKVQNELLGQSMLMEAGLNNGFKSTGVMTE